MPPVRSILPEPGVSHNAPLTSASAAATFTLWKQNNPISHQDALVYPPSKEMKPPVEKLLPNISDHSMSAPTSVSRSAFEIIKSATSKPPIFVSAPYQPNRSSNSPLPKRSYSWSHFFSSDAVSVAEAFTIHTHFPHRAMHVKIMILHLKDTCSCPQLPSA